MCTFNCYFVISSSLLLLLRLFSLDRVGRPNSRSPVGPVLRVTLSQSQLLHVPRDVVPPLLPWCASLSFSLDLGLHHFPDWIEIANSFYMTNQRSLISRPFSMIFATPSWFRMFSLVIGGLGVSRL